MILFQDIVDKAEGLAGDLEDKIKLLRALANFHIDSDFPAEYDDLVNQRRQMLKLIRQLEVEFTELATSWQDGISRLKLKLPSADTHAEPDDLTTRFVASCVQSDEQALWDPEAFNGSLLVFFNQGKIESASLIERKGEPESDKSDSDDNDAFHELVTEIVPEEEGVHAGEPQGGRVENNGDGRTTFTLVRSTDGKSVNFYFSLDEPGPVTAKIYDQQDKLVRILTVDYDEPGDYVLKWRGEDDEGAPLPRASYFCQLQVGDSLLELKSFELT